MLDYSTFACIIHHLAYGVRYLGYSTFKPFELAILVWRYDD